MSHKTESLNILIEELEKINFDKMPVTIKDITSIYQDTIPLYDGESNTLNAYIQACEFLVETFLSEPNPPIQALLLRIFQGKLRGRALQLISTNENCSSFAEYKNLLLNNFGDQRSETCLFNDMINIRPTKQEGAYKFGKRLKETLHLLLTQIKLRDNDANSRILKTYNYINTALQLYLQGILEIDNLTGIMVQVKQPADLEAAMSYVIEAENFNYRAGRSNDLRRVNKQDKKSNVNQRQAFIPFVYQNNQKQFTPYSNSTPFDRNVNAQFTYRNMMPQNNSNAQFNSRNVTPNYAQNKYPTSSSRLNVFAPRQNNSYTKPVPMDVDASFRKRLPSTQTRPFKRPSQQLNFCDEIDNDYDDIEIENDVNKQNDDASEDETYTEARNFREVSQLNVKR